MVETKPLFMFLVLPLTFLGLAVNGEKVVHTSGTQLLSGISRKAPTPKLALNTKKKKKNNNNYYIYLIIK